jgi:putative membrane-bound dehydrogenase-like protein
MKRYWLVVRQAATHALLIASLPGLDLSQPSSCSGQGFSPGEAATKMKLPGDVQVQLVASEPMIAQPVAIEFDARGRLWVIQYLQYPNPAGLKRATVDRWSRTTYDRLPEPPPHGPKGADRITILEDADGDGRADRAHDFIHGLNLATGLAFGHGGVFVLNVPYLLFYPDRDGDDVPDGDPIVCLSGFGMEDAHSVANSLTWGPDGWLYGCQGSTVTSRIRGIEFQQGVWRYHPLTHEFELFCEGGGNSWGLDFDDEGELIYSTNVGPYRHLHGVQGAYYWKSFGKHGALHNPYAFGYFDHIPHTNFTGGHVTDGGIIYQGTNLPARFLGRYLCGDLLGHGVQWHEMYRLGSTFTSSHGGYLLEANDTWFAPTDLTMAPDGAVYVADWYDRRTAHPDPDADWDRSNGRIYRIAAQGSKPASVPDLRKLPTPELMAQLGHGNEWFARQARRVLADRRDPEAILPLRTLVLDTPSDPLARQALWALYVSGGFNERFAGRALAHRHAPIRKWTVRLLADERNVSPPMAQQLADLAKTEPDVRVRMQLAASAQRLPAKQALPILETLLVRDVDRDDPYVPLLLWWALERHAINAMDELVAFFTSPGVWKSALAREVIQERLMRRWTAEGTPRADDACARLLATASDAAQRQRLLAALEQGFHDRPAGPVGFGSGGLFASTAVAEIPTNRPPPRFEEVTPALSAQLDSLWHDDTSDPALIRVAARTGRRSALTRARELVADAGFAPDLRHDLIRLLGELGDASDLERLLGFVGNAPESLQLAVLDALPNIQAPMLATELLQRYAKLDERVRARVRQVLLSRKAWAGELLRAVDNGRLPAADFGLAELRMVALHEDGALNELLKKHWGKLSSGSPEERLAEMRRLNNDLNAGPGDPNRGRAVFSRICAACHALDGAGGGIGPDLTQVNRADRDFLLASLVDPSAVIRKEFLAYEVETREGRVVSGVIVSQTGGELVLGTGTGERVVLPRAQMVSLRESALSVMPEGLLKGLAPQELRDLFGFLQRGSPINSKP